MLECWSRPASLPRPIHHASPTHPPTCHNGHAVLQRVVRHVALVVLQQVVNVDVQAGQGGRQIVHSHHPRQLPQVRAAHGHQRQALEGLQAGALAHLNLGLDRGWQAGALAAHLQVGNQVCRGVPCEAHAWPGRRHLTRLQGRSNSGKQERSAAELTGFMTANSRVHRKLLAEERGTSKL